MDNEKKKITFKDIITNQQYKAIASLIFYGCLILALIIFIRTTPESKNSNTTNTNNGYTIVETSIDGFQNIKMKNYNFKYTLKEGNDILVYEGKQFNDLISFTVGNKEYLYENGLYLEKENDKFILSDFSVKYFNFFDVDLIEKILSNSHYEDGEYSIDLKKLGLILENQDLNDSEKEVSIFIEKKNNIITKLEFDLLELSNDETEISLTLEYSNFNLIDDFSIKK